MLVALNVSKITDTVPVWDKKYICKNVIWVQKRAEFEADFKSDFYYCVQMFLLYDFFRCPFCNFQRILNQHALYAAQASRVAKLELAPALLLFKKFLFLLF